MFKGAAHRLASWLRNFAADRAGSVLPVFAIMAVVVIVLAGAGVDYGRAINSREVMANALDSAALAVASKLSTTVMSDDEIDELAEQVFEANLSSLGLKEVAVANLDAVANADAGTVTVTSTVSVPTYFIHVGGIGPEKINVGVETVVNYSKFDVELALVLDVTGSMQWAIGSLREAAKEVVDVLIPAGTEDGKIRISVVPYSVGVNLDGYAKKATNGLSSKCATERAGAEKYTDASYEDEAVGDGSATYRWEDCSSSVIYPLNNNRSELITNINGLRTGGYTAGQTGIAWGWYTISPFWKNLWPSSSEPGPYNDYDVKKFAIIMTDGDFNTHYDLENWSKKECEKEKKKKDYYGDSLYRGKCKKGKNDYWVERASGGYWGESSKRARKICDNMKKDDIQIYTIYFGSNNSSGGAKVMQYCASEGAYYQATSTEKLIKAFGNIAKKIQAIYLAK